MLLKDAISIPEGIAQGDLVFRLADAEGDANATLDAYVVTDQLRESFVEAVRLVRSAVDDGVSKASYLSGSFGAGKSNFMGVLQLLLDGHPGALAKPELAPVVAQLRDWQGERRFLTVPFHLIGARDLESAILGGYVDHLRRLHPDAPLPDVFADEPLLDNADQLRSTLGDDAFFATLGGSDTADDGWGTLGGWDAARYQAARSAPVGDTDRTLLVQALLDTLLPAYADGARANAGGYRELEGGLSAISRHAESLGYAGVILFLDELILWLLSRMADVSFATAEASKISKLVEGAAADRPVPIISVIARQRDLRELVGNEVPGLEKMAFVDQLDFQQGRFDNIVLDDSNLPVVAHHRLLRPSSDAGREALARAFADLDLSPTVRDALLGDAGGSEAFALTYPFSPAFLTVVVDVAGALQRTRTGLRVLLQLLVDRRDELTVGDLVPVGDLYDVLASSEDPLSDEMKAAFGQAKRLYAERFRPLLLSTHEATGGESSPGFRIDDRLVKTLLLAALVPNSAPFKDLTVSRLVALNHGVITSPVPGQETSIVLTKLRSWGGQMGELQLGSDPHDPTVGVVLSDVDTRAILASVGPYDNTGARRQLVRDLIVDQLGLPQGAMTHSYRLVWKGVRRDIDIRFGNVRDPESLSDSEFANEADRWKVIVDFPFDADGHTPLEDLARLDGFRNAGRSWRTAIWLPAFFTAEIREVLGTLVKLNVLLGSADRFSEATKNLNPTARASVRPQLEAQQHAARSRLDRALLVAYGVVGPDPAMVDQTHGLGDHFPSLQAGFTVRPPQPAELGLRPVLDDVIRQALAHTFPAAPDLPREVRPADLRKVHEICQQALDHPDNRLPLVPAGDRSVMNAVANPLRLGIQSEQAFVVDGVGGHWDNHFTRAMSRHRDGGAGDTATVGDLRRWMDEPDAMGLTREVQNLVLVVWAAATNRTFRERGGPARPSVERLDDHLEVVAQPLPTAPVWDAARDRAERIFGVARLPESASANGLAKLSSALADVAIGLRDSAVALPSELARLAALVPGGGGDGQARLATARSAGALIEALHAASTDLARVDALANATVEPSSEAVGRSLSSAQATVATVRDLDLELFARGIERDGAGELASGLAQLLDLDELAHPIAKPLADLYERARSLVLGGLDPSPPRTAPLAPGPAEATSSAVAPSSVAGRVWRQTTTADVEDALRALASLRERIAAGDAADLEVHIRYSEPDPAGP